MQREISARKRSVVWRQRITMLIIGLAWLTATPVVQALLGPTKPRFEESPRGQAIPPGRSASISLDMSPGLGGGLKVEAYQGRKGDRSRPLPGARIRTTCALFFCFYTHISYKTPPLFQTTSFWFRLCNKEGCVDSGTWTVVVDRSIPDPPILQLKKGLTVEPGAERAISNDRLKFYDFSGVEA